MTQQQLAEAIGVSNKTISKWECGRGMPELALIVPLCHILHTNINEFYQVNICWKMDTQKEPKQI